MVWWNGFVLCFHVQKPFFFGSTWITVFKINYERGKCILEILHFNDGSGQKKEDMLTIKWPTVLSPFLEYFNLWKKILSKFESHPPKRKQVFWMQCCVFLRILGKFCSYSIELEYIFSNSGSLFDNHFDVLWKWFKRYTINEFQSEYFKIFCYTWVFLLIWSCLFKFICTSWEIHFSNADKFSFVIYFPENNTNPKNEQGDIFANKRIPWPISR